MPSATLHGVRVITKPYFVIFAAFNASVTLNLAQRSFKVIHFGGNLKPVYHFIQADNSSFRSIINRFGDCAGFIRPEPIFAYFIPVPAKTWGVPFGVDP